MRTTSRAASAVGLLRNDDRSWMGGFSMNFGTFSTLSVELWGAAYMLQLTWMKGVKNLDVIRLINEQGLQQCTGWSLGSD